MLYSTEQLIDWWQLFRDSLATTNQARVLNFGVTNIDSSIINNFNTYENEQAMFGDCDCWQNYLFISSKNLQTMYMKPSPY